MQNKKRMHELMKTNARVYEYSNGILPLNSPTVLLNSLRLLFTARWTSNCNDKINS